MGLRLYIYARKAGAGDVSPNPVRAERQQPQVIYSGRIQSSTFLLADIPPYLRCCGSTVQGQTIGYVGKTGTATGYHLHYAIYRDGVAVNPLTLKLPRGKRLEGANLEGFNAQKNLFDLAYAQKISPIILADTSKDAKPLEALDRSIAPVLK